MHDALLSDIGQGFVGMILGEGGPGTPTPYGRLQNGDTVEL